MFTSNGLMCLSGVTMCRMFLSAIKALPVLLKSSQSPAVRVRRDYGAAIEPPAYADVQTHAGIVPAREARQTVRLRLRGREREPCRTPRALPNAACALALQRIEAGRNLRTGEAASALRAGKIISDTLLQLP